MGSKTPVKAREAGAACEGTQAATAFNARPHSVSHHPNSLQYSIPGTFEESELALDRQLKDTMERMLEKTLRARKGNKNEVSREINLSEHPYYARETSEHPSRYRVCSLQELRGIILDDNEGPLWYNFLSKAIAYDGTVCENRASLRGLCEEPVETKKLVEQYKQINDRFAAENNEYERRINLVQKELSHKTWELGRALEAIDSQNWPPQRLYPTKLLTGEDVDVYSH